MTRCSLDAHVEEKGLGFRKLRKYRALLRRSRHDQAVNASPSRRPESLGEEVWPRRRKDRDQVQD